MEGSRQDGEASPHRGLGPPRIEAWALLAQWCGGAHVGGDVYWTITRQNAVERRFGEVTVMGFFEGPG
ncbi:hypothetical protein B7767_31635 [Streptomyces sp. 13-12-16]|uniref:hypothetical protein n=1 Tax=Streptomyces sp. 13-12-16 TaxID=1570823 RepID=UPI000A1E6E67|nr:hypothetical protein [Streptomyces sp. 13-12-16]OSP39433.1 hypothetical protein B7767_31635 [Streptomyces sp. 13-12-16]